MLILSTFYNVTVLVYIVASSCFTVNAPPPHLPELQSWESRFVNVFRSLKKCPCCKMFFNDSDTWSFSRIVNSDDYFLKKRTESAEEVSAPGRAGLSTPLEKQSNVYVSRQGKAASASFTSQHPRVRVPHAFLKDRLAGLLGVPCSCLLHTALLELSNLSVVDWCTSSPAPPPP